MCTLLMSFNHPFDVFDVFPFPPDVVECNSEQLHNCHSDALCSDEEGSFSCTCITGFAGNGTFCYSKYRANKGNCQCADKVTPCNVMTIAKIEQHTLVHIELNCLDAFAIHLAFVVLTLCY